MAATMACVTEENSLWKKVPGRRLRDLRASVTAPFRVAILLTSQHCGIFGLDVTTGALFSPGWVVFGTIEIMPHVRD